MRQLLIGIAIFSTLGFGRAQGGAGANYEYPPLTGAERSKYADPAFKIAQKLGIQTDPEGWIVKPNGKGQLRAEVAGVVTIVFYRDLRISQIYNERAINLRVKEKKPNPAVDFSKEELEKLGRDLVQKAYRERLFTEVNVSDFLPDGGSRGTEDNSCWVKLTSPATGTEKTVYIVKVAREDGAWLYITAVTHS